MCRAKEVLQPNMKALSSSSFDPDQNTSVIPHRSPTQTSDYFFIFLLSFLPLHFLLPGPHQHSPSSHTCTSTPFIMALREPVRRTVTHFSFGGGVLSMLFFLPFFVTFAPIQAQKEHRSHPVRHPCQPPQVEPQTSPHCDIYL